MSFNTSRKSRSDAEILTHEAGRGFAPSAAMELLLLVTGSLFSGDTFYERDIHRKERLARLAEPVTQADPEFVAALAVYARQGLGLRSGPSALLAHLFWWGPTALAREVAQGVWLRGDEHLETLAYTQAQGWKLRKALKQAVAERLNTMSPAALLKYRRRGRNVSQKDALILCHPQPKDRDHARVYEYLVRGSQALPEAQAYAQALLEERPTWERILSEQGRTPQAWQQALPHLQGLSLVRNLKNLHGAGLLQDPEARSLLLQKLTRPEEVRRWRLFPYQWLLAIFQLEALSTSLEELPASRALSEVKAALELALEATLPPLPLQGPSLVLVDLSGSMFSNLSQHSEATYALAAASLGAVLYRRTGGRLYGFNHGLIELPYGPEASVARMVRHLLDQGGGGTCLGHALQQSLAGFQGQRVVIFTDEQVHDDAETPLRRWVRAGQGRMAYLVNVAGYAPLAFPEQGVVRVGGFSERLLALLPLLESRDPLAWVRTGAWRALA